MDIPLPSPSERAALDCLIAEDPDLARIEAAAGPLPWRVRPPGFPGLLQAIIGQQISNQAAAAIWRRLQAVPGAIDPAALLALPDSVLREAGFSRAKILYARALAEAFSAGRLAADELAQMDDEAAIARIASVHGLGRWTAEVYLLFALQRRDIFPAGDLVLAAAAAHLKGLPSRPSPATLRTLADRWRPCRGLAARLLWHHWRFVTGRPSFDDPALVLTPPAPGAPACSPADSPDRHAGTATVPGNARRRHAGADRA